MPRMVFRYISCLVCIVGWGASSLAAVQANYKPEHTLSQWASSLTGVVLPCSKAFSGTVSFQPTSAVTHNWAGLAGLMTRSAQPVGSYVGVGYRYALNQSVQAIGTDVLWELAAQTPSRLNLGLVLEFQTCLWRLSSSIPLVSSKMTTSGAAQSLNYSFPRGSYAIAVFGTMPNCLRITYGTHLVLIGSVYSVGGSLQYNCLNWLSIGIELHKQACLHAGLRCTAAWPSSRRRSRRWEIAHRGDALLNLLQLQSPVQLPSQSEAQESSQPKGPLRSEPQAQGRLPQPQAQLSPKPRVQRPSQRQVQLAPEPSVQGLSQPRVQLLSQLQSSRRSNTPAVSSSCMLALIEEPDKELSFSNSLSSSAQSDCLTIGREETRRNDPYLIEVEHIEMLNEFVSGTAQRVLTTWTGEASNGSTFSLSESEDVYLSSVNFLDVVMPSDDHRLAVSLSEWREANVVTDSYPNSSPPFFGPHHPLFLEGSQPFRQGLIAPLLEGCSLHETQTPTVVSLASSEHPLSRTSYGELESIESEKDVLQRANSLDLQIPALRNRRPLSLESNMKRLVLDKSISSDEADHPSLVMSTDIFFLPTIGA